MAAELATIGGALAFHPGEQGGVEGIALGAIAALPGAALLQLVFGRLLHRGWTNDDGARKTEQFLIEPRMTGTSMISGLLRAVNIDFVQRVFRQFLNLLDSNP